MKLILLGIYLLSSLIILTNSYAQEGVNNYKYCDSVKCIQECPTSIYDSEVIYSLISKLKQDDKIESGKISSLKKHNINLYSFRNKKFYPYKIKPKLQNLDKFPLVIWVDNNSRQSKKGTIFSEVFYPCYDFSEDNILLFHSYINKLDIDKTIYQKKIKQSNFTSFNFCKKEKVFSNAQVNKLNEFMQNISNIESCEHNKIKMLNELKYNFRSYLLALKINTIEKTNTASSYCNDEITAYSNKFEKIITDNKKLQTKGQSCDKKFDHNRKKHKLKNATHFVMSGAVNVREFPLVIALDRDNIIDILDGGTPLKLKFEYKDWGYFIYLDNKNDNAPGGWIDMSYVYPLDGFK